MKRRFLLPFIIILTLFSIYVDLPSGLHIKFDRFGLKIDQTLNRPPINIHIGGFQFVRDLEIKKGVDLAGGAHIVFQADMSNIQAKDQATALQAVRDNIERRINLYGITEPVVETAKSGQDYRLIVELAGVKDVNQAIDLIGATAQLDFRELAPGATEAASISDFVSTGLTGKDLSQAQVEFDPKTGEPEVSIQFSDEGAQKFGDITEKNIGKPLAIFLDEYPVTAPTVKDSIKDGRAVISGSFTLQSAKQLSIQLNAGALPVPVKVIEQQNIGASLGDESVQRSVRAGLIGLSAVIFFMGTYYGWLGVLADIALIIYGLVTLAIYKLLPVTLSLPGIAAFLLSVGMAVDSNILIFERLKEEIRWGKPYNIAMELGFGRAWNSIRDANVSTLITCFVLFNPFDWSFLNNSGMVRGFALNLAIGVLLSLFTGIVVSRTLIRAFSIRRGK
jgi:preprotein translocase subunit SecD